MIVRFFSFAFLFLLSLSFQNDYNDSLKIDNGSERILDEEKLMNIDLVKSPEDLRNENNKLLTTIDCLTQEKEKQDKQINEIQEYLVNERLTNKQLVKQLDKSQKIFHFT